MTNPGAEYDTEVKSVLKIRTVKPVGERLGGYIRAEGDYASGWNHTEQLFGKHSVNSVFFSSFFRTTFALKKLCGISNRLKLSIPVTRVAV